MTAKPAHEESVPVASRQSAGKPSGRDCKTRRHPGIAPLRPRRAAPARPADHVRFHRATVIAVARHLHDHWQSYAFCDDCSLTNPATSSGARDLVVDGAPVLHVGAESCHACRRAIGHCGVLCRWDHPDGTWRISRLVRPVCACPGCVGTSHRHRSVALFIPGGVVGRVQQAFGPRAATIAAATELVERLLLAALAAWSSDRVARRRSRQLRGGNSPVTSGLRTSPRRWPLR